MTDLGRLGIPGVVGAGLLLFCLSFGVSTLLPDREARDRLIEDEARLSVTAPTEGSSRSSKEPTILRPPPLSSARQIFSDLDKLADASHLPLEQASYRLLEEESYVRYEASFPLKGSYPDLRAFIKDALALSTTAYLDELSLQRSAATDPMINASVRLVYVFAKP